MGKIKIFIALLLLSTTLHSNTQQNLESLKCLEYTSVAKRYTDAVKLSNSETYKGFLAFCQLAFLGDHRAQFKVAKHFEKGIGNHLKPSLVTALAWAKISNQHAEQKRKSEYIALLKARLDEEDKHLAYTKMFALSEMVGNVIMIDSYQNKSKHRRKYKQLGSNIPKKD